MIQGAKSSVYAIFVIVVFFKETSFDAHMKNHNKNSHTELTLEEETSAVEFVKCTLCDERFMNELDKLKHVERKHWETLNGERKRKNLRLEDLEYGSDSDNNEPENDAKNQEYIPLKRKQEVFQQRTHERMNLSVRSVTKFSQQNLPYKDTWIAYVKKGK